MYPKLAQTVGNGLNGGPPTRPRTRGLKQVAKCYCPGLVLPKHVKYRRPEQILMGTGLLPEMHNNIMHTELN